MGDMSTLGEQIAQAQERLEAKRRRLGIRTGGSRRPKGLHVRCTACGEEKTGIRTSCLRRLRDLACEACGGRLRSVHWPGWLHQLDLGRQRER